MSTIVFIPYPETGHLNASFKVARSLQERGHRVYYLALLDFEDPIRRQKFEYLPIFEALCPKGFLGQHAVKHNIENFEAILREAEKGRVPANLARDLGSVLLRVQPDLLVVDLLLTNVSFSLKRSCLPIPMVLLNTQLFNPWGQSDLFDFLRDQTELILCPEEFDFPGTQRKQHSYYVEASIGLEREDAPFPWEAVDEHKPLIYCSFGSQSHLIEGSRKLFQAVIDCIARRPELQLILTTGSLDVTEFSGIPKNAVLIKAAPQLEVLKRANIMIGHGGFNSVKECIYFGVPMILFPVIRDHPAIAARVAYHGIGVRGDLRTASVEQIDGLIHRVSASTFRTRIDAMANIFRADEAAAPSVEIIEQILYGAPQSVTRPAHHYANEPLVPTFDFQPAIP